MQEEQTVNEKEYVFKHINSDFRILILHFAPLIAATRVLQCKVTPAVSASARFSGSGEQKCRQIKIRPVGSTISFHVRKGAVRLLRCFHFAVQPLQAASVLLNLVTPPPRPPKEPPADSQVSGAD